MPPWVSHVRCRGIPHPVYAGARRMGNCPQAGENRLPPACKETPPTQEHTLP